ncbi:MAG TPA: hypothetical protein VNH41_04300 [Steroidobacteraceae bacterium]|nr:hypothetical protein [Steroidobacteraceae bacterium]
MTITADGLVMLGKLQSAITRRRWRLAYALADALDAIIDANTDDLPYLMVKVQYAERSRAESDAPVS